MGYKGFTYTPIPKTAWDSLSMQEKSEMMRVAVRNGITDLKAIRDEYNRFAEGGNTKWTMEDEAKYMEWRQSLPDNLRLTNDNDYDMRGAFKAGMQPSLESDGLYHLGSRDPKTGRILKAPHHPTYLQAINTDARMGYYPVMDNRGQTYTQTWEGNKFGGGGFISLIPMPMVLPRNTEGGRKQRKVMQFLPVVGTAVNAEEAIHNPTQYNVVRTGISAASDLFGLPLWRGAKSGAQIIKEGLPTTKESVKETIKAVTSPVTSNEAGYIFSRGFGYGLPLADTGMDILESTKAEGGKIHIKPENRGKFTALKERTGHSATWFKEHGTPAQKKMAVFALNSRHWKHGEGGFLQGPIVDMAMANIYGEGGGTTPEENVFQNFVVRASEDPMVIMARQNPKYRQTLADMYDTFLTRPQAERLLNVYNEAGRPRLKPLPEGKDRAFTRNNIFMPKPVMYLSSDGKDPEAGLDDLIAELAHPIQSKYGNNKVWKERLNPFYHEDDYRGRTRYDFPNKYESETHEDFEPLLHHYVLDNWLPGQRFLTEKTEGEKPIGNDNHIFNPDFPKQVTDSARVYNRRKQDMDYQYVEPRGEKLRRNKILSFFGDLF